MQDVTVPPVGREIAGDRYAYGFDRWEYASIGPRFITCQMLAYFDHAIDPDGLPWWWDDDDGIWRRVPEDGQAAILEDNALFIALARHSVPVIRVLWLSPVLSERKEAKEALGRVAAVLCDRWRRDGNNANWRWHAGSVYRDATRECRWQLIDASLRHPSYSMLRMSCGRRNCGACR